MAEKKQQPSGARGAGNAVRRAAGGAVSQARRAVRDGALTMFPAANVLRPLFSQSGRVATQDFIEGVVGTPERGQPVARVRLPRSASGNIVDKALSVGRAAQQPITPQERLLAGIDSILRRPHTLREMQAAAGMMPANAPPPGAKDVAIGAATDIADVAYQAELKAAAAVQDQAARDEANAKATDRYFNRIAAISGANMNALAMQDVMNREED